MTPTLSALMCLGTALRQAGAGVLRGRTVLCRARTRQDLPGVLMDTVWTPALQVCSIRLQVLAGSEEMDGWPVRADTHGVWRSALGMHPWLHSVLGHTFMNSLLCRSPVPGYPLA